MLLYFVVLWIKKTFYSLPKLSLDKNIKIKTDSLDITYCIIYISKKTAAKLLKLELSI